MNPSGMDLVHSSVNVVVGYDLAIEHSIRVLHVQAGVLGTFEQHLPAVEPDGPNFGVLPHKPPPRKCDPHELALLVALCGSILCKAVRKHRGGRNPVVGDFFVPWA